MKSNPRKAIEPRPFPLIGNLSRYAFNPLAESIRARKRHGRVVRYWIRTPAQSVVAWLITSPDHAEQLLVERHRSYRKADTYESLRWALGDGMLTAEGDLWRRQRRIATPAFGRDRLREMLPVAVRHTAALAERLAATPATVDLHREANALALLVLCETIFSTAIAGISAGSVVATGTRLVLSNAHGVSFGATGATTGTTATDATPVRTPRRAFRVVGCYATTTTTAAAI
jgi:cytochrome P450